MSKVVAFRPCGSARVVCPTFGALALAPQEIEDAPGEIPCLPAGTAREEPARQVEVIPFPGAWDREEPAAPEQAEPSPDVILSFPTGEREGVKTRIGGSAFFSEFFSRSYERGPPSLVADFHRGAFVVELDIASGCRLDGSNVIAEVNDQSDGVKREYLHGQAIDELAAFVDHAATGFNPLLPKAHAFAYHQDAVNSVRRVTAIATAANVAEYAYAAFGKIRSQTGSTTEETARTFTGREQETADLFYYRARYYHAGIGRFTSIDPDRGNSLNPPSLNRYIYVVNNPVNLIDPSGLGFFKKVFSGLKRVFNVLKPLIIGAVSAIALGPIFANFAAGAFGLGGTAAGVAGYGLSQGVATAVQGGGGREILGSIAGSIATRGLLKGFEAANAAKGLAATTTLVQKAVAGGIGSAVGAGIRGSPVGRNFAIGFAGPIVGTFFGEIIGKISQGIAESIGAGNIPFLETAIEVATSGAAGGFTSVALGGTFTEGFRTGAAQAFGEAVVSGELAESFRELVGRTSLTGTYVTYRRGGYNEAEIREINRTPAGKRFIELWKSQKWDEAVKLAKEIFNIEMDANVQILYARSNNHLLELVDEYGVEAETIDRSIQPRWGARTIAGKDGKTYIIVNTNTKVITHIGRLAQALSHESVHASQPAEIRLSAIREALKGAPLQKLEVEIPAYKQDLRLMTNKLYDIYFTTSELAVAKEHLQYHEDLLYAERLQAQGKHFKANFLRGYYRLIKYGVF